MIKWEFKIKHVLHNHKTHFPDSLKFLFTATPVPHLCMEWLVHVKRYIISFIYRLKELLDITMKWIIWDTDNIQQSSLTPVFTVTTPYRLEGGSDCELPSFDTVQHCKQILTFWRNMPPCSALKIKSRFDTDEIKVRG